MLFSVFVIVYLWWPIHKQTPLSLVWCGSLTGSFKLMTEFVPLC
jgi:hypothetical protein